MSRINPTVRGFAIIILIAVGIWLLQLQTALVSLLLIARIAFFLAIAFFLFLVWRERRGDIAMWQRSSQVAFYAAVALAATEMIAFGCMWSTCLPGTKECSGVSMLEGRGLRLKVVWL